MCSLTSSTAACTTSVQLDRAPPAPGRLRPGQDDQVLGVAPHPGGQVVQLAEPGPDLGRGAADLELVDHLELALDQALAAPGQVEEHVADAAAQGGLAARDPDRDPVDRVERLGQVADLVPGPDLDRRRRLGLEVDLLAVLEPLHDAGQPMVGRLLGRRLQPAHGPDQRAGGDEGQHHGQHQGGDQEQAVQPGPAVGGLLDGRLVAITSALRRCSTSRIRSSLTLMAPNQAAGRRSSLRRGGALPGPPRRTGRPARPPARRPSPRGTRAGPRWRWSRTGPCRGPRRRPGR